MKIDRVRAWAAACSALGMVVLLVACAGGSSESGSSPIHPGGNGSSSSGGSDTGGGDTGTGGCTGAATGHACGSNGDCCNYQEGNGFCVDFGQGGLCADSCKTDSDCDSGCCSKTSQGNWVCSPPAFCARDIDVPCDDNAECTSGLCSGGGPGWCTQECSSTNQCPGGGCVENGSSVNICFPLCNSTPDCAKFGVAGLYCQPTTTADGYSVHVCST
jgi:hypothetical protein